MGEPSLPHTMTSALVHIDGTLNSRDYIDNILNPIAIPFGIASIGQGFLYQDDNARPHAARIVQEYHEHNLNYTHLEWPAYSPDLSSIELLWDTLGRAMADLNPKPRTKEELLLELQIPWHNIAQTKVRKLIRSMGSRVKECIASHGGPTHY